MKWRRAAVALIILWAAFEVGRSLMRLDGVIFTGYTQVGEEVLRGGDPYRLPITTWPPFFLFLASILALLARLSVPGALLLWQCGSVAATWGTLRLLPKLAGEEPQPLTSWAVLVPLLMSARLLQEHLQHTQINLYVLFLVVLAFYYFRVRRDVAGGLALAAAASLRAVPVIFLPYLLYKRAWRAAGWTAGFLLVLNLVLPLLTFGTAKTAERWRSWRAIARAQAADPTPTYMNQSLLAALKRLLTTEGGARDPVQYAVASWPTKRVVRLFYLILALGAGALAVAFRRHPPSLADPVVAGEVAIGLCLLPILSPLGWKAHFVTVLAGYWIVWWARPVPRGLWWTSFACLSLSAAALWGGRLSHVLESWNVITVGGLLVVAMTLRATIRLPRQPPANAGAPTRP